MTNNFMGNDIQNPRWSRRKNNFELLYDIKDVSNIKNTIRREELKHLTDNTMYFNKNIIIRSYTQ